MVCSLAAALVVLAAMPAHAATSATRWDRPASELASRIAEALGPASAHLEFRNLSTIPAGETNVIQHLLEDDLKSNGVTLAGAESANAIRVTLSKNTRGGLWVAEIVEGNETKVVMEPVDLIPATVAPAPQKVTLQRQVVATEFDLSWMAENGIQSATPILAAAQANSYLVVLTPDRFAVFRQLPEGWIEEAVAELGAAHARSRDPRGVVTLNAEVNGFSAFTSGIECTGTFAPNPSPVIGSKWTVHCHASDDPWPVMQTGPDSWTRAFYNAERDYFTGVIAPAWGADLPPFYTAGYLPGRASGPAMLLTSVDGRLLLAESGQLKPVAGARDWGSDFAVVSAGCGAEAQVIVSSSGDSANDSLRAYELPAQEAVPVSEPMPLAGGVMAIWPAPDGKSVFAIVRTPMQQSHEFGYEVDRVTESCN
ncbi:MAG TPA: hypothetical protein VKB38_16260 [Terracidiphilus sp.]|nr:hypothetical protein [Terracidiphilus sp.]